MDEAVRNFLALHSLTNADSDTESEYDQTSLAESKQEMKEMSQLEAEYSQVVREKKQRRTRGPGVKMPKRAGQMLSDRISHLFRLDSPFGRMVEKLKEMLKDALLREDYRLASACIYFLLHCFRRFPNLIYESSLEIFSVMNVKLSQVKIFSDLFFSLYSGAVSSLPSLKNSESTKRCMIALVAEEISFLLSKGDFDGARFILSNKIQSSMMADSPLLHSLLSMIHLIYFQESLCSIRNLQKTLEEVGPMKHESVQLENELERHMMNFNTHQTALFASLKTTHSLDNSYVMILQLYITSLLESSITLPKDVKQSSSKARRRTSMLSQLDEEEEQTSEEEMEIEREEVPSQSESFADLNAKNFLYIDRISLLNSASLPPLFLPKVKGAKQKKLQANDWSEMIVEGFILSQNMLKQNTTNPSVLSMIISMLKHDKAAQVLYERQTEASKKSQPFGFDSISPFCSSLFSFNFRLLFIDPTSNSAFDFLIQLCEEAERRSDDLSQDCQLVWSFYHILILMLRLDISPFYENGWNRLQSAFENYQKLLEGFGERNSEAPLKNARWVWPSPSLSLPHSPHKLFSVLLEGRLEWWNRSIMHFKIERKRNPKNEKEREECSRRFHKLVVGYDEVSMNS